MILKLCLSIFCVSVPSLGQAQWDQHRLPGHKHELTCHQETPSKCAMVLEEGETAPMPGVFQSFTQAAEVAAAADAQLIGRRIRLEVRTATNAVANDLGLTINLLKAENVRLSETLVKTQDSHTAQLQTATPSWYERPAFVAPVVVVGTLLVVGAAVVISCELNGCGK